MTLANRKFLRITLSDLEIGTEWYLMRQHQGDSGKHAVFHMQPAAQGK